MTNAGLWVQLEAKEGKEDEVEAFLESGGALVAQEPGTIARFAIRTGPRSLGIFDAFNDEAGREAHLSGAVATALMEKAGELLSSRRRS
ncbi:MAG TPA: antibiotic biosynthesis monooxygenase [Solirubrobacterales bacterium]|nr:antibiotic biosynthesis monooxygenase [Solirubrobacterales bacterium]